MNNLKIGVEVMGTTRFSHMMGGSLVDTLMFVTPADIERTGPVVISRTFADNAPFVAINWI